MRDTIIKTTTALANDLLASRRYLACAESCTGGMAAGYLTALPGSSQWFDRGWITYSNSSKRELLGVQEQTLAQFGAVSEEVALEMAKGARQASGSDVGFAITGIAGPTGGTNEKPVGTVCFGFWYDDELFSTTQLFKGDRESVRDQAAVFAFQSTAELLAKHVKL